MRSIVAVLLLATPAAAQQGGTIVLTPQVVNQLVTGLKAGQAERDAAAKEETPYGKYLRAQQAYTAAKSKCEAAQASWPQRAAANPKLNDKYSALMQKMVDAMQKQDQKLAAVYQDSAMALMSPSCLVKEPEQPSEYYEAQRAVEVRAEAAEAKASGWKAGELASVKERADAVLRATPASDISASEKSAVSARAAELKPLMGIQEQQAERAQKAAPAPSAEPAVAADSAGTPTTDPAAAAAATATEDPAATAAATNAANCMVKNMETHKAELEKLQKEAEAAQQAGDQGKLIQIAQRMQQIQMAGCAGQ